MCIFPANLNESGVSTFLTKFYHVTLEEMLDQYAKTVKSFNLDKAIPLAMQKDNHFMVQLLLKKGALCDTEILDYLINQSYRVPSVFLKSHYLETLLERGANINALDAKQRNTLINFIIKGKLKEAQLLVERDANPLQKDIKGKDAFSYLSQLKRVYGYEDNGGNISALFDVMLSKVKPTEKSEVLKKVVTESVKSKNWFLIIECMNKGFDYNNTLIMGKKLVQLANISGEEEIAKKINTLNSNQNKKLLEIIYQKGDPSGLESLQKMTPIPQQDIDLQMKTLIELLMNKEKSYLKLEAQFRENNDDTSMDSHFWYQLEEMDLEFQENKNRIESLIFATQKMGGNLDLKDPKGRTYLMKAIQEGAYETAKVLISLGVDIHAKDSLGFDALSYLVTSPFSANGNIDVSNQHVFTWEKVYEALVERDVNLKGVDNFGFGGVEKAILNQNYNIALRLLEDGAPFSKNVLEEKLGEFSKSDAFDPLVRMIIDRGLSTEKVGHDGRDPLMNSLLHGAIENACLIGNHKENLSHVDKAGNTVYHYMTDAVKRAQELYQEDMPFEFNKFRMNKFKENFEKMMEIAFSKNKNLDQRNDLGITPLLHALNHGVLALARRLMNNNARMDICDNMGNNPFHFMCKLSEPLTEKKQERFLGLMKSFYENGVNPFKENIYGDTPLSLAEASGNSLAIKTILGYYYELPVDGKNKDGATQLMKACFDGNILDIRRLMSKDIEKTMKDHEGKTPLFYAVMGNQPQAIAELAKTLSDVQILDQKGNSAIDTAIHYNKPEALFTLLNIYEKEIPYLPVKAESLEQLNPLLREHMHRMSKNDEDVCIEFITYQLRKMSPNHRSLRGFSISNAMGEFHHQPKLTGTRNHANTTLTRKIGMGSKRRGAIVILKPRIMHNGKGSFVKTFSI
jgi:ankyrin repeat protein